MGFFESASFGFAGSVLLKFVLNELPELIFVDFSALGLYFLSNTAFPLLILNNFRFFDLCWTHYLIPSDYKCNYNN